MHGVFAWPVGESTLRSLLPPRLGPLSSSRGLCHSFRTGVPCPVIPYRTRLCLMLGCRGWENWTLLLGSSLLVTSTSNCHPNQPHICLSVLSHRLFFSSFKTPTVIISLAGLRVTIADDRGSQFSSAPDTNKSHPPRPVPYSFFDLPVIFLLFRLSSSLAL